MPTVKFEWNLGTLIPLAGMAVAMAVAWGDLTSTVEAVERRIEDMELAASGDDLRLRTLETSQSNMAARLDAIAASLNELKADTKETNALLREVLKGRGE